MPLPPALLQRLKKRGIIKQQPSATPQEEIIAENYDDEAANQNPTTGVLENRAAGAPGCPNKCNPYHMCVEWCWDHWNDGTPEDKMDQDYNRKRLRMLRLHPLPASWKEIYDPGVGRYYYWNVDTDEVCWMSPTHPKAKITVAACRVAKNEWEKFKIDSQVRKPFISLTTTNVRDKRRRETSPPAVHSGSDEEPDYHAKDDGRRRSRRDGKKQKADLDPMDPAAYSEVPRGKWSTGLESKGDAKTGADSTASGPLFQQRPYPAPGAILRQNMEQQQTTEKRKRRNVSPPPDDL